jgi:hypothetical protein
MAFIDKILPAPVGGGFAMDDYWVWCGSVIQGEDQRYHMFAARWPKSLPFFDGYKTYSEVVRAVSARPEGPYVFQEQVLPARGTEFWDGRMTHNPTIHKYGDTYLLFYIGGTYEGPSPSAEELRAGTTTQPNECYASICIGLATAPSVLGPWTRPDEPVLGPRPNKWDGSIVTNPAPCVLADGRILLYYRSNTPDGLRIGAARAEALGAPFQRISEDPVLVFEGDNHVEDPCVWWAGDHLELLAKDMTGGITGEEHAGVHATSPDGLRWTLSDPPKAYSRRVVWDDGSVTVQGSLERPQLLFHEDDAGVAQPTHLFCATGDGPGGFRNASRTWNMVLPLKA